VFNRNKRRKALPVTNIGHLRDLASEGKPVLVDFWQVGCGPCKVMDGIVDELADEYGDTAHVVKVDVTKAHGAVAEFGIRSTPTFVLLTGEGGKKLRPRWRQSGLVKKDELARLLEREGAVTGS
jgi:thioredoxin 1